MRSQISSALGARRDTGDRSVAPLWHPQPGPQTDAYESPADDLLYGGAAGGGKSDLLIGLGLTKHRRSIIFRREFPQLAGMIDRIVDVVGNWGRYNGQAHAMRLDRGDVVEFGACQYERDVQRYQGRPHDFIGFDEVTHFTERQYRFLKGWARTTVSGQRVRTVAAGNPPTTSEGEWVIRYWAPWLDPKHPDPAPPGELRWFAHLDGEDVEVGSGDVFTFKGEQIHPTSRTFIPARLEDNPLLAEQGYAATLQSLPEPLRSQLLYGDFGLTLDDHIWQAIPTDWVRSAMDRWQGEPTSPSTAFGVDCARGGRDAMIISPLFGVHFGSVYEIPGRDVPNGKVAAMHIQRVWDGSSPVNIDVIGIGASVYDHAMELTENKYLIVPVNTAESAPDGATDRSGKLRFRNLRAWAWWKLREGLDPLSGCGISMPPDPKLLADLTSARYRVNGDVIQIESKDDIIKRLGRSPDRGDAVTNAWLSASQPVKTYDEGYQGVEGSRFRKRGRGWA